MGSVHRESYWLYDVVSYDVQKSLAIRSMAVYWYRCRIFIKLSSLNEQAYHVEISSDTMMWNWIENIILVLNINLKIRLQFTSLHQLSFSSKLQKGQRHEFWGSTDWFMDKADKNGTRAVTEYFVVVKTCLNIFYVVLSEISISFTFINIADNVSSVADATEHGGRWPWQC